MRWHIFGANSYVAGRLIPLLEDEGQNLFLYTRNKTANSAAFDLAAPSTCDVERVENGDIVVLLAANSSADACQQDYESIYRINVVGTERLVSLCLERGARVVFFSSDLVFGGADGPCNEMTSPSPYGSYAKMKLEIETMFRDEKCFKVLRPSTILSKDARFIRYLSNCDEEGKVAEIYGSFYRNFIFLGDVVDAVFKLGLNFDAFEDQYIHLCGDELLSRADLTEIYRQVVSPRLQYTITEPAAVFYDARPKKIELRSVCLNRLLGRSPTTISCTMRMEFGGMAQETGSLRRQGIPQNL